MADNEFFSPARLAFGAFGAPPALISVRVTGEQPPRVGAVNDPGTREEPSPPKSLGGQDSCEEHNNEAENAEGGDAGGHTPTETFPR